MIGYVQRRNRLLKDVLEGKMLENRVKGRPKMGIIDDLIEDISRLNESRGELIEN